MGLSASKRVTHTFTNSSEFNSVCGSVFDQFVALTGGSFPGVLPYQLFDAAGHLQQNLSQSFPIVKRWASSRPSQAQVDQAYRSLKRAQAQAQAQHPLGRDEFRAFALELFTNIIVSSAAMELLGKVPFGVAGIAGIGMATRVDKNLIAAAIGVYALGAATRAYISLA